MRNNFLICLSVLVALLGAAEASKHMKIHPWKLGRKQELLQTKSTAETVATTEANTESEAECNPECVYKFPYLDSECSIPEPPTQPGEIFITDFEGCFTFDLTVVPPKEPQETFVLDTEACYDFRSTGTLPPGKPDEPEHPGTPEPKPEPTKTPEPTPPGPEKDETCETKVTVYRYPFIDPDANCTVEKPNPETIEVVNPDKSITPETIVVVDEDGRTTVSKVDEYGEYHAVPPDVSEEPLVSYDEEGEIILDDESDTGEAKEEFVLLFDVCYTYEKDADTGETIYENHEDVTTGEDNEQIIIVTDEENVVIDEEKEVVLIPPENNPGNDPTTPPPQPTPEPPGPPKNETEPTPTPTPTPEPPRNETEPTPTPTPTPEPPRNETEPTPTPTPTPEPPRNETEPTPTPTPEPPRNETEPTPTPTPTPEPPRNETEPTPTPTPEPPRNETEPTPTPTPEPPRNETTPTPTPTPEPPGEECTIYDNYTTGTTIVYGQPVTYITKNTYDVHDHHSVSYTYVLTNIYSGIFKTEEYNYVIYGAGAVNFYNNYYHIDARVHDTPSCSCTCGYQTYTFSYSFGF